MGRTVMAPCLFLGSERCARSMTAFLLVAMFAVAAVRMAILIGYLTSSWPAFVFVSL